ncbi:MAG: hypothetical protein HRU06_16000 [Oceanospirillaceae bacterium]|nr:hypothetical protein [Oceanospirillaceae bacterium]
MHVDKAKKRIAKQTKKGFKGYPLISLEYFGNSEGCATQVLVQFTIEEGAEVQEQRFSSETDARESEVIQSALVKIIERSNAASVTQVAGVSSL